MEDSDDEFEIDMGTSNVPKPEVTTQKTPDYSTKPSEPKKITSTQQIMQEEEKKEAKESDDFDISGNSEPQQHAYAMHMSQEVISEEILPIPLMETQNTYFLMNHISLVINSNGQITPILNNSEVYSNSAAWALYGKESQGYNFLITGGGYWRKLDFII
jgi:hypothetical protein